MEETLRHLNIKALAEDDRPREKLMTLGRQALSDSELIAILLGSGNKTESAVQLAQRMLSDHHHNINLLAKLNLGELKRYKGVGAAKAISIAAAFELGRRRADLGVPEKTKITSSRVAYDLLRKHLTDISHEELWILLVDRANQVIKEECGSKGGISGTVVDIRLICRAAVEHKASGVIVAHNHPSGNITPSGQDKAITKKIKAALQLFDVALLDHLIIGEQNYLSFADHHLL